jgi:hypothetical protein
MWEVPTNRSNLMELHLLTPSDCCSKRIICLHMAKPFESKWWQQWFETIECGDPVISIHDPSRPKQFIHLIVKRRIKHKTPLTGTGRCPWYVIMLCPSIAEKLCAVHLPISWLPLDSPTDLKFLKGSHYNAVQVRDTDFVDHVAAFRTCHSYGSSHASLLWNVRKVSRNKGKDKRQKNN